MEDEPFIKISEVSQITGMSREMLAALRFHGTGPKFYKPTQRTVLYKRSEVMAWINASAQTITRSAALAG